MMPTTLNNNNNNNQNITTKNDDHFDNNDDVILRVFRNRYLFNEIFKRVKINVLELDVQFDYPSRNLVKTWHRNIVVKNYKQLTKDLNWVIRNKYNVVLKEILQSMIAMKGLRLSKQHQLQTSRFTTTGINTTSPLVQPSINITTMMEKKEEEEEEEEEETTGTDEEDSRTSMISSTSTTPDNHHHHHLKREVCGGNAGGGPLIGGTTIIYDQGDEEHHVIFEPSSPSLLANINDPVIISHLLELFPHRFGELFFTIHSPRVGGSRITRFKSTNHFLQRIITTHGNINIWNQIITFIDTFRTPPSAMGNPTAVDTTTTTLTSTTPICMTLADKNDYRLNQFETYLSRLWKHKEKAIIKLMTFCILDNRRDILINIMDTVGIDKINQYLASDLWLKVMENYEISQPLIASEMIEFLHGKLSKYPFNRIFRDPVHALLLTNNVKLILDNNICIENPNLPSGSSSSSSSSSSALSAILNAFHPSSSTSRKKREQHFKDLGSFCPYIIHSIIQSDKDTPSSNYPIQSVYQCAITILSKYKHILGSDPSTTIQNTIASLLPMNTINSNTESRSLFFRLCLAEIYFTLKDKIGQHTIHMQLNSLIYQIKQLIIIALNNSFESIVDSNRPNLTGNNINNNNNTSNSLQKTIIKYLLNRCGFSCICEFGSLNIVQQSYQQLKSTNFKNNNGNNVNNSSPTTPSNNSKYSNSSSRNNNNGNNIIMIEDKFNCINLLSRDLKVLQFIEDILKRNDHPLHPPQSGSNNISFDLMGSKDAVSIAIQKDRFDVVEYLVSHFHSRCGFVVSIQAMSKLLSQGYFDLARMLSSSTNNTSPLHYSYDQKVNSIEMAKFYSIENKPLPIFYRNDDKRNIEFIQYLLDEYIRSLRGMVDTYTLSSPYGYFMSLVRCAKKSQTICVIDYLCNFYEKVKSSESTTITTSSSTPTIISPSS